MPHNISFKDFLDFQLNVLKKEYEALLSYINENFIVDKDKSQLYINLHNKFIDIFHGALASLSSNDWKKAILELQSCKLALSDLFNIVEYQGIRCDREIFIGEINVVIACCNLNLGNFVAGLGILKTAYNKDQIRGDAIDYIHQRWVNLCAEFKKLCHTFISAMLIECSEIVTTQDAEKINNALMQLKEARRFLDYVQAEVPHIFSTIQSDLNLKYAWLSLRKKFPDQVQRLISQEISTKEAITELEEKLKHFKRYIGCFDQFEANLYEQLERYLTEQNCKLKAQAIKDRLTAIKDSMLAGNLPQALKLLKKSNDDTIYLAKAAKKSAITIYDGAEFNLEQYAASLRTLSNFVDLYKSRAAIGSEELANKVLDKVKKNPTYKYYVRLPAEDRKIIKEFLVKNATENWHKLDRRNDEKTLGEVAMLLTSEIEGHIRETHTPKCSLFFSGYTHYLNQGNRQRLNTCIQDCFSNYTSAETPPYIVLPIFAIQTAITEGIEVNEKGTPLNPKPGI